MSYVTIYTMKHPTVSEMLNDLYQRACQKGFTFPGCVSAIPVATQEVLDVINQVNSGVRELRNERDFLIASLENMEKLHVEAAVAAKGIKEKAAHYQAASDARRALGKGDL